MSKSRPRSPLAITGSNTSEIDNSIDAKYDGSLNEDSIQHQLNDDEVWDLFSKVHTLHKEKETSIGINERRKRTRIGTMGGFVVNKTTLLKLYVDKFNYVTIHIRSDTKASDAIQKIKTRRNLPQSSQCKLYQDNQEIDDNANLHEIMQISSGAQIQVRFIGNDELKLDKDHHLIDSIVTHEDDEIDISSLSPYRTSNKNINRNPRRRAFPNKMNLVAFNEFSVQKSDDNDVARDQVLTNIEQQLKKLPRQQYNVVKINKYNKHQKRILKLTQYGIENIKPATSGLFTNKEETVTSFHLWENITNSYLEDSKTIRISYKDYKDGDRKYETSKANDVNESIQKRLKIIRDQKTDAGRKEISIKFQKKLINQQIANNKIFNLNDHVRLTRNRSGIIVYKGFVHFAPSDHYGIKLDDINGDHDGFYDGIRYFKTKSMKAVIVPESHIIRKINVKKVQQNGRKERHMTFSQNENMKISSPFQKPFQVSSDENDNMVEEEIYKQLKAMILSNETIEGKYRLNFANKFHKYVKEENLLELVRDFMDAVKEKIDEKHGEKYKEMILKSWHRNDDMKDEKKQMTSTDKANELSKLTDTMNKLIESAVEETILQAKISETYKICLDETREETQILSLKIDKLRRRQQAYFGIKKELESTTNWNRAVYELSLLRDCTLPSEKIKSLVNCAHGIYLSHAKEMRENEKVSGGNYRNRLAQREQFFITGDDFLPIVIYVIVQASKNGPCINDADLRFMEGLVDPATSRSEPGYYLAVFHAALQWIRCFNN